MSSLELGFFLTKKKMPNKWRTIKSLVYKIDFIVDEEKERLNPSREKNRPFWYYRSDNGYFFSLDSPMLLALLYMGQPP